MRRVFIVGGDLVGSAMVLESWYRICRREGQVWGNKDGAFKERCRGSLQHSCSSKLFSRSSWSGWRDSRYVSDDPS